MPHRADLEAARDRQRLEQRASDKRHRDRVKATVDELVPKESGHAAKVASRRAKSDKLHGAAREAGDATAGLDLPDSAVLGGGSARDLGPVAARRQAQRAERGAQRLSRVAELQAAEEARMKAFRESMGLKEGAVFVIPERPPGQ